MQTTMGMGGGVVRQVNFDGEVSAETGAVATTAFVPPSSNWERSTTPSAMATSPMEGRSKKMTATDLPERRSDMAAVEGKSSPGTGWVKKVSKMVKKRISHGHSSEKPSPSLSSGGNARNLSASMAGSRSGSRSNSSSSEERGGGGGWLTKGNYSCRRQSDATTSPNQKDPSMTPSRLIASPAQSAMTSPGRPPMTSPVQSPARPSATPPAQSAVMASPARVMTSPARAMMTSPAQSAMTSPASSSFRNMVAISPEMDNGRTGGGGEEDVWKRELQIVFRKFDKNNDGKITKEELGDVLRSLGDNASDEDLAFMIQEVDKNGDGAIDLDEFVSLNTVEPRQRERELQAAFGVFDKDKNGYISAGELYAVLSGLDDRHVSHEEVEKMIENVDVNGDGVVDFWEFKQMMGNGFLLQ